jgi:hypothetical protein
LAYFSESNEDIARIKDIFERMAIDLFEKNKLKVLVIDSTRIRKLYARTIEHLCYDYDGCLGCVTKGLTVIVAIIASARASIPLNFKFYISKKACPEKFLTKIDLAISLTKEVLSGKVRFDYIAMDGGFMSINMITFLIAWNLRFVLRIARNRIVFYGREETCKGWNL